MTKFQSDVMDKINNCKDPETALMAVVKVVDEFLRAEGIVDDQVYDPVDKAG